MLDHILLEWNGEDEEVEEGAVRVDGDWERVEAPLSRRWGERPEQQEQETPEQGTGVSTRARTQTGVCEHVYCEINSAPLGKNMDDQAGGKMCRERRNSQQ